MPNEHSVLRLVGVRILIECSVFEVGWSEISIRLYVFEVGGVKITNQCSVFEVGWNKMPIRHSVF